MSKFAWVTLATNDSYSLGALVVAASLRRVATAHQIAVLITPGVTEAMRTKLSTVFDVVKEVNILDSRDSANLALLARPELGVTFTKLHCWNLTQYEKCVFLDADTLVLHNCDELFEREEFAAAPDVGWPDCFNSGVFVFRPSQDTFGKILDFAVKAGSFDGGDQGLLNLYFADWAHSDISKHLPFVYNTCSTATYSYLPAFKQYGQGVKIIHFIGTAKPWLQNFDPQTRTVRTPDNYSHLASHLQTWWTIFFEQIHPHLSGDMNQQKEATSWYEEPQHVTPCPPPQNPPNFFPNSVVEIPNEQPGEENHQIHFYDPWEVYEKPVDCQKDAEEIIHREDLRDDFHDHYEQEKIHDFPNEQPYEVPPETHRIEECQESHTSFSEVHESHKEAPIVMESKEIDPGPHKLPATEETQWESRNHIDHLPRESPSRHPDPPPETNKDHPSILPEPQSCTKLISDHLTHSQIHSQSGQLTVEKSLNVSPKLPEEVMSISGTFGEKVPSNESGIAGALASVTLGEKRTPEQEAWESQVRRQSWESGNIDYMGKDSFENILKRINVTMGVTEETPKEEEVPENAEEGNQ
uniref:glycogenin glucosyltransferase n=1 Tax=Nyssomyia neivai TaxID=330878 RepID=A0A1L8E2D2_9DIPT